MNKTLGLLLLMSLGANAWLGFQLHKVTTAASTLPEPAAMVTPVAEAPKPINRFTLISWDYKISTMDTDGHTVAARCVEGSVRNDSSAEAGELTIFFTLLDKNGAKVDETSAVVHHLRTNEVWKFKTPLFKYALTAKFSQFTVR